MPQERFWTVELPLANAGDLASVADDPPTPILNKGREFVWATVANGRMPGLAMRLHSGVEVYLDGKLHSAKGGRFVIVTAHKRKADQIQVQTGFERKKKMITVETRKLPPGRGHNRPRKG